MSNPKATHGDERTIKKGNGTVKQRYNQNFGWINLNNLDLFPWKRGDYQGDTFLDYRWIGKKWVNANFIPMGSHARQKQRSWRRN